MIGPPKENFVPKTCKIQRDFGRHQTSIANISGTVEDIQNLKNQVSTAIPPAFDEKSPVNFDPLTTSQCLPTRNQHSAYVEPKMRLRSGHI